MYGFTDDPLEVMTVHLLGRRQRVKLDGVYSQWRAISAGVITIIRTGVRNLNETCPIQIIIIFFSG